MAPVTSSRRSRSTRPRAPARALRPSPRRRAADDFNVTPSPGYSFPNVAFDLPDDPNGIQATGHAICAAPQTDCKPATATDRSRLQASLSTRRDPGTPRRPASRFSTGRSSALSLTAPLRGGRWRPAPRRRTSRRSSVDTPGTGYTSVPTVAVTDTPPPGFPAEPGRSRRPRPTRALSPG